MTEQQNVGKPGNVSEQTITFWMVRLQELTAGYWSENTWDVDKSGCFFKALHDKGLVEKGKRKKIRLNQLTEKPTRSTLGTVSLIDHILTNSKERNYVRNYGVIYKASF